MTGRRLGSILRDQGFDFLTGVRAPALASLFGAFAAPPGPSSLPQPRADAAVGLAAGAALGSARAVVALWSPCMAHGTGPLSSLSLTYRLPLILLVAYPGRSDVERARAEEILSRIGIPHAPSTERTLEADLARSRLRSHRTGLPTALLIDDRTMPEEGERDGLSISPSGAPGAPVAVGSPIASEPDGRSLNGSELVRGLVSRLGPSDLSVLATGTAGKIAYLCRERDEDFYLLGSPGMVGPVAAGVAFRCPGRRVWGIEGEESLLSMLGAWTLERRPPNLVQVVLAGGRSRPALPPESLASTLGFARLHRMRTVGGLELALAHARETPGPHLLYADLEHGLDGRAGRFELTPAEIRRRFQNAAAAPRPEPVPAGVP
jgi:phosphonopyruvate decarboxylase